MLELTIHESFPTDANTYVSIVASIAQQWGAHLVKSPATIPFECPAVIKFDFYCVNKCNNPHDISADAHKKIVSALVECRVFSTVKWRQVKGFVDRFCVDGDDPHVVVRIV